MIKVWRHRIKKLETIIRSHGFDQLKVEFNGKENWIQYHEEVLAINDVSDIITVVLKGHDQLDWLEDQLNNIEENRKDWVGEWSFRDRQAINERYGFS